MGDEFKTKLEAFIQTLVLKIGDKSILEDIQKQYEELIDHYSSLTVMTKDEFESFDSEFVEYDKRIDQLTKDNNDLTSKLTSLNTQLDSQASIKAELINSNQTLSSFQSKLKGYQSENMDLNIKLQSLSTTITELKAENKKLSNENFDKFEKLNTIQKDIRLKSNTIDLLKTESRAALKAKEDTESKLKETEKNAAISKMYYDNQIIGLKKQVDQLTKDNCDYKKNIVDLQGQVREFQRYTNMAKVNADHLDKKEFSILEVMSQRVQVFEAENEAVKSLNIQLKKENEELNRKIAPLERLVLFYMKKDNDDSDKEEGQVMSISDISDEEMKEIEGFKSKAKELFEVCVRLKNENWVLKSQIEQITIECNQRLRSVNTSNTTNTTTNSNTFNSK